LTLFISKIRIILTLLIFHIRILLTLHIPYISVKFVGFERCRVELLVSRCKILEPFLCVIAVWGRLLSLYIRDARWYSTGNIIAVYYPYFL